MLLAMIVNWAAVRIAAEDPRLPQDRPNIVVLLADDLAYGDLGCLGQRAFATPHLDRVAAEGRLFRRTYAAGSWCAPSRTGLMTGLDDRHWEPLARDAHGVGTQFRPTLAEALSPAGYASCAIGKWHMLEPAGAPTETALVPAQMPWHRGFTTSRIGFIGGLNYHFPHALLTGDGTALPIPENAGVDDAYFRQYYGVDDRFTVRHHGEGIYDAAGRFVDGHGHDITQLRYSEDLYRHEACDFIARHRTTPFLLWYASTLVHFPIVAKRIDGFADRPPTWTVMHKAYAASVQEFDASVGAIMATLRAQGLERNTIVLITSDNGYTAGFHFPQVGQPWGPQLAMWDDVPLFANRGPWNRGKHINTLGGVVVPGIVWGPQRIAPGVTDRVMSFVDVMATVTRCAGVPTPATDGVAVTALWEGRDADQPVHPPVYWSGDACQHAAMSDDWQPGAEVAVRPRPDGPYRPDAVLLEERWFAMGFHHEGGLEVRVFDAERDPGQCHDLALEQPAVAAQARAALLAAAAERTRAGRPPRAR